MTYRNTGWKAQLYGDLRVPPGGLIPDEAIPPRAIDHLVRMGMIELVHEAPVPAEPPALEPLAGSSEPEPEPDASDEGVSAVDEPPAEPEPAPKRRAPRKPRTT